MNLWIQRLLALALAASWAGALLSGAAIFRQKREPELERLPPLIRLHVGLGVLWAALLLAFAGLACATAGGMRLPRGGRLVLEGILVLAAVLVASTGHGLRTGKPRGAFVHVFYALVAAAAGLALASEHLRNLLP